MELVHDDLADVGRAALAQREVGQDLRCRAHDRSVGVDARVPRHHADPLGAEHVAQREELLADQRLDRGGVEAAAPLGQRQGVRAGRDQRLPRPGRCRQHDV